MSDGFQKPQVSLGDDSGAMFFIRWRGRQEGPYTAAAIEAKLAANQIGLLHEISYNETWVTLRDYLAERAALERQERQARDEQARRAREEDERATREREDQRRAEMLAEERRKNDLLQASLSDRRGSDSPRHDQPMPRKAHRAGTIQAMAVIGLFLCGPFCVAAWIMGDSDLREMDAGIMDNSGRASTSSGRTIGMVGTIIWIILVVVFMFN